MAKKDKKRLFHRKLFVKHWEKILFVGAVAALGIILFFVTRQDAATSCKAVTYPYTNPANNGKACGHDAGGACGYIDNHYTVSVTKNAGNVCGAWKCIPKEKLLQCGNGLLFTILINPTYMCKTNKMTISWKTTYYALNHKEQISYYVPDISNSQKVINIKQSSANNGSYTTFFPSSWKNHIVNVRVIDNDPVLSQPIQNPNGVDMHLSCK